MARPPTGADDAVLVSPPLDEWAHRAAELIEDLRWRLPAAEHIDHIGSTAIPGMFAKDVLDLQISVSDLDAAAAAFDVPLGLLGFSMLPYLQDHVPAGRPDPADLWKKRIWARRGHSGGDVNLHVRLSGSPNERLALLFRDWFRSHPEAIPAYSQFKVVLSRVTLDVGTYSDVKDPVVDLVIAVGEGWAVSSGWKPHPGFPGKLGSDS
jgi:GrpB-like predicted nucleotidyltransferase (UPF0157 family)